MKPKVLRLEFYNKGIIFRLYIYIAKIGAYNLIHICSMFHILVELRQLYPLLFRSENTLIAYRIVLTVEII